MATLQTMRYRYTYGRGLHINLGAWWTALAWVTCGLSWAFMLPPQGKPLRVRCTLCTTFARVASTRNNPDSLVTSQSTLTLAAELREELLSLVNIPPEIKEDRYEAIAQRIDFVVGQLKETYVPPQTLPFMNLLLQGCWLNIYNSWTVRRSVWEKRDSSMDAEEEEDEDDFLDLLGPVEEDDVAAGANKRPLDLPTPTQVIVRDIHQTLSPNLTKGAVVNSVDWECTAGEDGDKGLTGTLTVRGGYEVNSRGTLEVGGVEHDLTMLRAPRHADALIKALQRAVPFDVFDMNGTFVETAFLDHELRVTQTHSTRFGTITSLYRRNHTN